MFNQMFLIYNKDEGRSYGSPFIYGFTMQELTTQVKPVLEVQLRRFSSENSLLHKQSSRLTNRIPPDPIGSAYLPRLNRNSIVSLYCLIFKTLLLYLVIS